MLVLGFGMAVVNIGAPLAFSALYGATGAYGLPWLAAAGACLLAGLFVAAAYRRHPIPMQE